MSKPLEAQEIADLWDWDISENWVRLKLVQRIYEAGLVVIRESDLSDDAVPEGAS